MKYEEFMQIADIVDKIKQTDLYGNYERATRTLLADEHALALLDTYHAAQEQYTATVLDYSVNQTEKDELKAEFLTKKMAVNNNDVIAHHLTMQRTMEFLVDDLNYEINQMVGKKQKSQCGIHKKKK
jgi:cell fate (sporulation/competence/biofilm development) regulator YlbF (YheA/YmcA/DUF963 family)